MLRGQIPILSRVIDWAPTSAPSSNFCKCKNHQPEMQSKEQETSLDSATVKLL